MSRRRFGWLADRLRGARAGLSLLDAAWKMTRLRVIGPAYRRVALRRVTFIGVTGSCGKTSAKELIAAVLATTFAGQKNRKNRNLPNNIVESVLQVRPWDGFFVQEIAAARRGDRIPLERPLSVVRPQIGVVTNIGTDHISAFGTVEAIAAEKSKLVAALPPDGTAVLNADDPNVIAMREKCAGRVITYGLSPDAMMRAENVRSRWPERLSFTVRFEGASYPVQTQLCGAHWAPCVLAALAVGVAMGVPLARGAEAIAAVLPTRRRMCPVDHPSGVTFIQDDAKAPFLSVPPALDFMRDAQAHRKIAVIGTLSDTIGQSDRRYVSIARLALDTADIVIFTGRLASKCLKAKRHPRGDALHAFNVVGAARDHLWSILRPGDLVLLKGTSNDHLDTLLQPSETPSDRRPAGATRSEAGERVQAVVGLGNPGEPFQDTRHNVGQRVVDLVAERLGTEWKREDDALVARYRESGRSIVLIKPLTYVNGSGPVVQRLGQRLGFGSTDCVVVYDDLHLPLGTIRTRMAGSDGGHRGVRSVLQALGTDAVPRVKIGVGRPRNKEGVVSHVVAEFTEQERPVIEKASVEATTRILELSGVQLVTCPRPR